MSYYPSKNDFVRLSAKGNLIPVYKEILADLETPVSAFLKIKKNSSYSFLLESVEGQEKIARFSFLGANPALVFKSKGKRIEILKTQNHFGSKAKFKSHSFLAKSNPIDEIKNIMSTYKFVHIKDLPRFCGGLVGYIGYDAIRFFEDIPDKNPDELHLADCLFMLTDCLIIFDHLKHRIKIVVNAHIPKGVGRSRKVGLVYNNATKKIQEIEEMLLKPLYIKTKGEKTEASSAIKSNFSKQKFCSIVRKAKEYIKKGDVIQVVLSQRLRLQVKKGPFDVYRALRSLNPSAYMYYLEFRDSYLVGSSPELLVRCENGIVETRPIAGTRPRAQDDSKDKKLEEELLKDEKERAEHLMLVDLGRNDLGRISQFGSVKVTEFMKIEKYSHVMHLVSNVKARLKTGKDSYDVLAATFPAGTVSGSPKIRAMEIIDELENVRRGPYAGAVGYFSFSGNLDTCITIRTIIIKGKTAYVQAGAGIVADSRPESEFLETLNKAKAQLEAIKS